MELFKEGDQVLVRAESESEWTEGQVVAKAPEPRSYVVDNGAAQLRNRTHFKPAPMTELDSGQEAGSSSVVATPKKTILAEASVPTPPSHTSKKCPF